MLAGLVGRTIVGKPVLGLDVLSMALLSVISAFKDALIPLFEPA